MIKKALKKVFFYTIYFRIVQASEFLNASLSSHHHVAKRLATNMTKVMTKKLGCVRVNEFNSDIILFVESGKEKFLLKRKLQVVANFY